MAIFILRVQVPSAPKISTEIMIKGDTLEEALKGAQIQIEKQQRVVKLEPYTYAGCKPNTFYRHIYYRRDLMRKIML